MMLHDLKINVCMQVTSCRLSVLSFLIRYHFALFIITYDSETFDSTNKIQVNSIDHRSFLRLLLNGNRIGDCRKTSPILSRNEKSLATFPILQKRSFPSRDVKSFYFITSAGIALYRYCAARYGSFLIKTLTYFNMIINHLTQPMCQKCIILVTFPPLINVTIMLFR